jgi:hypothetical protein
VHCGEAPPAAEQSDADVGLWTEDNFPSYIRRITHFGQRAECSHDGTKILFLEKTYGDADVMDLASGVIRAVTHHYYHNGYTRALYLPNPDEPEPRGAGFSEAELCHKSASAMPTRSTEYWDALTA